MNLSGRSGRSRLAQRRRESNDDDAHSPMSDTSNRNVNVHRVRTPLWGRQQVQPQQVQNQKPQGHLLLNHKSFLTMALVKLEGLMSAYCKALADPSHANAAKACAFLDSSVATATSTSPVTTNTSSSTSHTSTSPRRTFGLGTAVPASPRTSKLLKWLTVGNSNYSPSSSSSSLTHSKHGGGGGGTSSALALEGEWETYTAPFQLLAGAEVLYADMTMAQQQQQSQSQSQQGQSGSQGQKGSSQAVQVLISLYQRIVQDLVRVEENLCTVFLDMRAIAMANAATSASTSTIGSNNNNSGSSFFEKKAVSLSLSIKALTTLCTVRCQWLELELSSGLFAERSLPVHVHVAQQHQPPTRNNVNAPPPLQLGELAAGVSSILASLTTTMTAANAAATSSAAAAATVAGDVNTNSHKDEKENDSISKKQTTPDTNISAAHVLLQALTRELSTWKYALEAMYALEQCQ